ncbi:hypothetical protein PROFUN_07801 [Planoprotostelium fungivorum]|uniref:Queuine tRNA-ribosyltransferase catalytic subunit 1 n=1 Tax=Planoprotostelium fungivorum TaxID=1890364 RepID=A0A2P6MX40_9EUKA|nr:hypothetical protein PROFUN_07801 [Planoprotostelium fungivorum]
MSEDKPVALRLEIVARWGKARATLLHLPHAICETPMFMPVGTQGTIKGLTSEQVEDVHCNLILGNTYHLGHRPGPEVMKELGGLHQLMNWKRNLLTDSGGFQMVSLLQLANITEQGVVFRSPHDGSEMVLTPEMSMQIQNCIGADIMMALDDVVSTVTTGPRVEEAMHRTLRWIDRCVEAHKRPHEQNLFGIVQGGLDMDLRSQCLKGLVERDLPGYAIGGLSGGESKHHFWRVVDKCAAELPENKPRYLMGVGYSLDLLVCSCLGVDMFDCVYPSRTARFGVALVKTGTLILKHREFSKDFRPLDDECQCMACRNYTRAYLHSLVVQKEQLAGQLLTAHNLTYQMDLMRGIRNSIIEGNLDRFAQKFIDLQFPNGDCPSWARDALKSAGIDIQ